MKKADFVKNHLAKLADITFEEDEALMLCPFHDDHKPSLRVSLTRKVRRNGKGVSPGGFHCWSCGASGGWNALAEKLKLPLWDQKDHVNTPDDPYAAFTQDIDSLKKANWQYRKPATDGPWTDKWRELPASFLQSHGAELLWDRTDEDYRIFLPLCDLNGNLMGHVAARPDHSTIPDARKYIMSYSFPSDRYWFCLERESSNKVVIVEGPYDTLRFRHHGIPAIGAFGVSALSEAKILQLIGKGISKVILCLDGDRAGRAATTQFFMEMKRIGLQVADMDLTRYAERGEKIDPGNCPEAAMQDIKVFLQAY